MPHTKSRLLPAIAAAALLFAFGTVHAQIVQTTQAAPTGQVPKAYTGVQSAPAATFKPKPTGQIAPEAPGQLGTIVQPAPAATPTQKASEVQDLGFEVNSRPSTQKDRTQKAAANPDARPAAQQGVQSTQQSTQLMPQTTQPGQATAPKAATQRTDPQ